MAERDIEQYMRKKVKQAGGMFLKFVSPGTRGVPDRIMFIGKKIAFVELKAPGQKSRPDQVAMQNLLEEMYGQKVFRDVDTKEKADAAILEMKQYETVSAT